VRDDWIELSDGVRLFARTMMPREAEQTPVPAILEYLPYRLTDHMAFGDSLHHPYFAGHGYAAVRVDMRGSGNSDGILLDEYLPQEQLDACEVIAWLADQPWCSGRVGIFGKSWGGFNGLQIAARRPPALRAVISAYSTDDRYADDVHYMGGCLLAHEALSWGSFMLGLNALPPDPAIVGDRWRQMWRKRLEQTPFFVEAWLAHQRETNSGGRVPSARTTGRSTVRCCSSGGGRMGTRTPSVARSRASRRRGCRAVGWSDHGATGGPRMVTRVLRSAFSRSASGGGTSASRKSRTA
jgi:predicted acyl esterase